MDPVPDYPIAILVQPLLDRIADSGDPIFWG